MQTKVIINHDSHEALRDSPLWKQIMDTFLVSGPVTVIEVGAVEEEIDEAE